LDDREAKLLRAIVSDTGATSAELASRLKITRRQLDYSLQKLNRELNDQNLPVIKRTRAGAMQVTPTLVDYVAGTSNARKTTRVNDGLRYRDEVQRGLDIIFYILVNEQYISLDHLYIFLEVGKTTVIQDLKGVTKALHEVGLALAYDRQNGYRITGPELNQRRMLLQVTTQLLATAGGEADIQSLTAIKHDEVAKIVAQAERKLGTNYSDKALHQLVASLQADVSRTMTHDDAELNFSERAVRGSIEYDKLRVVIPTSWYRTEAEFEWLVLIFLSTNTWQRAASSLEDAFAEAVDTMISRFEEITYTHIDDREEFRDRLVSHLQPAFYRVKYGMPLIESAYDSGEADQTILLDIVREVIKPIEKLAKKKFPDNELRLISYYFGLVINDSTDDHFDQSRREAEHVLKALIVSNTGIVQTHILYSVLEDTLPEVHFVGATSVREFDDTREGINIVFATVPLQTTLKQFIVPVNMNQIQRVNLRYRVLREMDVIAIDEKIAALLQIITKNAAVSNLDKLRHDLQAYLVSSQTPQEGEPELPDLMAYLAPEHIQHVRKVADWRSAITQSAAPLLADGSITGQYLARIIAANEGEDAYSFLGTAMAIPHADAQGDVKRDGFGVLVLDQPVAFPNGMAINIVVTLALVEAGQHIKAINQLAEIALNKRQVRKIVAASNPAEIYELFKAAIKESSNHES
jgi:transcriptional antiterminator/mannitol/fructose-specific phosphotransferase system IIA component (Ntr-type)